ncbi:MAG: Rdx family protein [Chloroflexi bacterium]|nr:Rdx family protein [Chloroflexota bacterium]
MTDELLGERKLEYFIKDYELIPSDGGRFEFEVDGNLKFSKKQQGRHAEPGEIKTIFTKLVDDYMQTHNIVLPDED